MAKKDVVEAVRSVMGNPEMTESEIIDSIVDNDYVVWESGCLDEHRWYIMQDVVHKVFKEAPDEDGLIYVKFTKYIVTGDNSLEDMCLEYDLDDFEIVERKTRVEELVYYE